MKTGSCSVGVGAVIDASRDIRPDFNSVLRTHFSKVAEQLIGINMNSLVARMSAEAPGIEGDSCIPIGVAVSILHSAAQAYTTLSAIFLFTDSYMSMVFAAARFQLKREQFL